MRIRRLSWALVVACLLCVGLTASASAKVKPYGSGWASITTPSILINTKTVTPGGSVTATVTIRNRSKRAVKATKAVAWLSTDAKQSRGDARLGQANTPKIAKGKSRQVVVTVTIPLTTTVGEYFLIVCADGTNKVREKNERDNCRAGGLAVASVVVAPGPDNPGPPLPVDTDSDGVADSSDNCVNSANADQADNDADGKGDVCDPCPLDSNPGIEFCPSTIANVRNGAVPVGTDVAIDSVFVVAVSGSTIWVQSSTSAAVSDGLKLTFTSPPGFAVGNTIDIGGNIQTSTTMNVSQSALVSAAAATLTPVVATAASLNGSPSVYAEVFVRVNGPDYVGALGGGEWQATDGNPFVVSNDIIGTLPSPVLEYTRIDGIASHDSSQGVVRPRTNADLVPAV